MKRDTKTAIGISFVWLVLSVVCILSGYFHGVDTGEHRHKMYISKCILEKQGELNVTEGCDAKIALALWDLSKRNWVKEEK